MSPAEDHPELMVDQGADGGAGPGVLTWAEGPADPVDPVDPAGSAGPPRQRKGLGPARALAIVAVLLVGIVGFQVVNARPAEAAPTQDGGTLACGSLPVISEACQQLVSGAAWAIDCGLGGVEGCAVNVTDTVVAGAFDYFARWVAVGAIGAIDMVWVGITGTTTPVVDTGSSVFQTSMAAARALAFPLLVLAALYSLLKADASIAVKSAFLYLPGSVLGMVVAGYVITALLAATDQFSNAYINDGQTGIAVWLNDLGGVIAGGVGVTAPILLVVFSFVLIAGSILVWLIMIVRSAAILITYAFMPLAFAAMIFPATRSWIRRLIEIQLSFILAKPVILAVLALGSQTLNDGGNALVGMMQAAALFFLASFSPFALMKLLPFVGDEAVGAMESPSRAPSRAASTAVGVIGGTRIAAYLAGSQQGGPSNGNSGMAVSGASLGNGANGGNGPGNGTPGGNGPGGGSGRSVESAGTTSTPSPPEGGGSDHLSWGGLGGSSDPDSGGYSGEL